MQRLENRLEREQILSAVVDDENVDLLRRHCRRHGLTRRRSDAVRRRASAVHALPGGAARRSDESAVGVTEARCEGARSLVASASSSASADAIPAMLSTRA